MRRDGEVITELGALMDAVHIEYGSRKYSAGVELIGDTCVVRECFDTGGGHSGAFRDSVAPVLMSVFHEAVKLGYIAGKLMPGYVSKTEFVVTQNPSLSVEVERVASAWRDKEYWTKRSLYEVTHGTGPGTYIKITSVPEGEAPEEVRKAWVGMVLPCDPVLGRGEDREKGAVTKTQNQYNRLGYSVPQKEALKLLEGHFAAAAHWWKAHGYPKEGPGETHFSFAAEEAVQFAGIFTVQKIIHMTEEVQGDPNR